MNKDEMKELIMECLQEHDDNNRLKRKLRLDRKYDRKLPKTYVELSKHNTSGVTGVFHFKDRNKWQAKLIKNNLGFFDKFNDAVEARYNAEQAYHDPTIFNDSPAMRHMIKIGRIKNILQ